MFTEVKKIIVNHAKQIDTMKKDLAEQKKRIYADKEHTKTYNDRQFAEAKEKYNANYLALIHQSKADLNDAFAVIFTKLEDSITAEIGQETIAEFQMLCDMTVSEFEINAYAKKFAGKYKALRLLNKIAEKQGIPFTYITDDDIICDLNILKGDIVNYLNTSNGSMDFNDERQRLLFMAEGSLVKGESNRFTALENKFNDFMNPFVAE